PDQLRRLRSAVVVHGRRKTVRGGGLGLGPGCALDGVTHQWRRHRPLSGCSRRGSDMGIRAQVVVGLIITLSAAAPARAQSGGSSGVIHGVVTDESGAALPGVTATLTSPALQVRQMTTVSDATGNYRFGELPVGVYSITFELGGFTSFIRNELRLPVGFDAKVDVVMKIGNLEESVTVTGGSPVIDVTTTTKSVTLNTEIL